MKSCPRCGRQNEDDVQFCGRCGLDTVEYERHQARPSSDDEQFCYRHPKEQTNLKCGRCLKPICTKCAAIGPAGPRCPDCAKQNIEFRPAAVVHSAKRTIFGLGRMGPYGIWIAIIVGSMVIGMFRGCGSVDNESSRSAPSVQSESESKN
ncbi:MAG: zinc-ribbon domain-containing protein [Armatimonadota bacterium]